jgi:CRP-like cAMP-binding protein
MSSLPTDLLRVRAPDLTDADVDVLGGYMVFVRLEPGQALLDEGVASDALYLLSQGRLVAERDGLALRTVEPGQWVGEISVLDPGPTLVTLRAQVPSMALSLAASDLQRLRDEHPLVASKILRALALEMATLLRATTGALPPAGLRGLLARLLGGAAA